MEPVDEVADIAEEPVEPMLEAELARELPPDDAEDASVADDEEPLLLPPAMPELLDELTDAEDVAEDREVRTEPELDELDGAPPLLDDVGPADALDEPPVDELAESVEPPELEDAATDEPPTDAPPLLDAEDPEPEERLLALWPADDETAPLEEVGPVLGDDDELAALADVDGPEEPDAEPCEAVAAVEDARADDDAPELVDPAGELPEHAPRRVNTAIAGIAPRSDSRVIESVPTGSSIERGQAVGPVQRLIPGSDSTVRGRRG